MATRLVTYRNVGAFGKGPASPGYYGDVYTCMRLGGERPVVTCIQRPYIKETMHSALNV